MISEWKNRLADLQMPVETLEGVDAPVPYLLEKRNDWGEPYGFPEECSTGLIAMAESHPNLFYECFEMIGNWNVQLYHVVVPLMKRYCARKQVPQLVPFLSSAPEALDANEGRQWTKATAPLAIVMGMLVAMGQSSDENFDADAMFFHDLLRGFLARRRDAEFLRIVVGCYLVGVLRGDVEEQPSEIGRVRASKRMFNWLASPKNGWSEQAGTKLMMAFGGDFPEKDGQEWCRFVECGIIPENRHNYMLMFLAGQLFEIPLCKLQRETLALSCFIFPSAPLYWDGKCSPFSRLGLHVSDYVSREPSPERFMKQLRSMIAPMLYRMRVDHQPGVFSSSVKIAELYLMVMVCLINHCCMENKLDTAKELFGMAWPDCVTGLYLGAHGVWMPPAKYIQYLFYYNVAFLSAFSSEWNNSILLERLPLRMRNNDSMTYRELCIGCLLKNEETIPWDDIAQSEPQLYAEIESCRKKATETPEAMPRGQ